jgi:hypothetical protein
MTVAVMIQSRLYHRKVNSGLKRGCVENLLMAETSMKLTVSGMINPNHALENLLGLGMKREPEVKDSYWVFQ